MIQVTKEFTFDSAHFLPSYYGKCVRMHGHTFKLWVTVEGPVDQNGLAFDFVILKKMVNEKVVDKLDHQLLNELIQLPSAENIAIWIWNQLVDLKSNIKEQLNDPNLPQSVTKYFQDPSDSTLAVPDFSSQIRLAEVKLWETPTSFVTYTGD